MDMRMGTHEIEFSSKSETIDNVIMASSKLTQIILEPKFNIVNNEWLFILIYFQKLRNRMI